MKAILKSAFFTAFLLLVSFAVNAQARLTIENNSMRSMTVKVMKEYSGKASLHKTVFIGSYNSETIYFLESGYFFTKTKAVLNDKSPIYQKGESFEVTNDDTGYSVMTLTFSIIESALTEVTGGIQISKQEFDKN